MNTIGQLNDSELDNLLSLMGVEYDQEDASLDLYKLAVEKAEAEGWDEKRVALALHLDCSPGDLGEARYNCHGLTVYEHGSKDYAVGDDSEADEAWDQALDSYLDDTGVLDSIPENLRRYFDRAAWKEDARDDGRGHALASYDDDEIELNGGFYAYRLN